MTNRSIPVTPAVPGQANMAGSFPVALASDQTLPLPAGAATSANQPALNADGGALAHVTNFPTTQAVAAAALPLPAGAATDGSLTNGNQKTQVTSLPSLPAGSNAIGSVTVSNLPATQAVSAASLPLPAGAATDASLTNGNQKTQVTALPALPAGSNAIGTVSVSNLPATQAVSAAALPLPAGAATDASLTNGNLKAQVTSLPSIPAGANAIGSVTVSNLPATQAVSAAALPLPAGAATDASLQSILSAIKATVNISGSVWFDETVNPPVYYVRRESVNEGTGVITVSWETPSGAAATPTVANLVAVSNAQNIANENSIYTATAAGTGYASGDTLIHAFGIDTSTSPAALAYSFWFNAGPSVVNGTILTTAPASNTYAAPSITGSVAVTALPSLPPGANAIGSVSVSNFPATQAVSVSSLPLPASAATDASLTNGNQKTQVTSLPSIPAGANAIGSVTVSNLPATQAVSAAALPLPAGAATDASLTNGNQKTQVTSLPSIPAGSNAIGSVTVSNLPATQAVSAAALPLPTGAATDASLTNGNQKTQVTSLPALPAGANAIGSVSVSNLPATQAISAASLPLPTGAAQDGTDATGVPAPTGGVGIRGWLSGIYSALINTITVSIARFFTPTANSVAGSITTASTDQVILAANAARKFLMIQNTSATATLVLSLNGASTATATTPTITLQPGQVLTLDSLVVVSAIRAQSSTAGATYSIIEG